MLELAMEPRAGREPMRILCLGAHCDDIDIGCGGTLLKLLSGGGQWDVTWVAFSSNAVRARELRASAARFLRRAARKQVLTFEFPDTYFPAEYAQIKKSFETLKAL